MYTGKRFPTWFSIFAYKIVFSQNQQLLWSRCFFRHQDCTNQLIPYIDVIFAVRQDTKWNLTQFGGSLCLKKHLDPKNWAPLIWFMLKYEPTYLLSIRMNKYAQKWYCFTKYFTLNLYIASESVRWHHMSCAEKEQV